LHPFQITVRVGQFPRPGPLFCGPYLGCFGFPWGLFENAYSSPRQRLSKPRILAWGLRHIQNFAGGWIRGVMLRPAWCRRGFATWRSWGLPGARGTLSSQPILNACNPDLKSGILCGGRSPMTTKQTLTSFASQISEISLFTGTGLYDVSFKRGSTL
jgi:hypothetical protein